MMNNCYHDEPVSYNGLKNERLKYKTLHAKLPYTEVRIPVCNIAEI